MSGRQPSRGRLLMHEKEEWARRLLAQGLTISQISTQLACSRTFVSKIARELHANSENGSDAGTELAG